MLNFYSRVEHGLKTALYVHYTINVWLFILFKQTDGFLLLYTKIVRFKMSPVLFIPLSESNREF